MHDGGAVKKELTDSVVSDPTEVREAVMKGLSSNRPYKMPVPDELLSNVDPLQMDGVCMESGIRNIEKEVNLLGRLTLDLFFDVLLGSPEGRAACPERYRMILSKGCLWHFMPLGMAYIGRRGKGTIPR